MDIPQRRAMPTCGWQAGMDSPHSVGPVNSVATELTGARADCRSAQLEVTTTGSTRAATRRPSRRYPSHRYPSRRGPNRRDPSHHGPNRHGPSHRRGPSRRRDRRPSHRHGHPSHRRDRPSRHRRDPRRHGHHHPSRRALADQRRRGGRTTRSWCRQRVVERLARRECPRIAALRSARRHRPHRRPRCARIAVKSSLRAPSKTCTTPRTLLRIS
jgi:hypothetical protein